MKNSKKEGNEIEDDDFETLIFGYWDIKFKAQGIRFLLHYVKDTLGPWKEYNPSSTKKWMKKKVELSKLNPLVSIPFLKSQDSVFSRSGAIMMAICMKANRMELFGKNMIDAIKVRSLQSAIDEIRIFVYEAIKMSREELEESYEEYWQGRLRKHIDSLNAFLGSKKYLMGYVSVADLDLVHMIELCNWLSNESGIDDPFLVAPNLMNLRKSVLKLPGIEEYVTTPDYRNMVWMKKGACRFEQG